MKIKFTKYFVFLAFAFSCTSPRKLTVDKQITSLKFLSEYTVPYNFQYKNTTVGGLSGIDYDPGENVYYMICDDRSDKNPARFYTAKLLIRDSKIDSVIFTNVTFLENKLGKYYPNAKENPYEVPDPEAMRWNTKDKNMVWTSEGERIVNDDHTILLNPAITEMNKDGQYIDTFELPKNFRMQSVEKGPRRNGVFEGLSFSDDFNYLFISTEEPLYEDGPRAGLQDTSGIIRIIKYDVATKKPIAQFPYIIDPVAYAPIPKDAFKVNGVSDILWLNEHQLLVVERSFSVGRISNTIKVYIAEYSNAENIQDRESLQTKKSFHIMSKKLLLNMDTLQRFIDNIEGVTFGPDLPNGKKSLIFVSDNNFNPMQRTQFLLFEIN